MSTVIDYPFTMDDMEKAADEWNCNCGPAALAFALQVPLDAVRGKIPGFEEKGYTSPSMMKAGLSAMRQKYIDMQDPTPAVMFVGRIALVRIQFTGPWTAPGANPKWAYRATHWIATWQTMEERGRLGEMRVFRHVFDCNGGVMLFENWVSDIVPRLTASIKRSDGGWCPTHIWRLV